LFNENSDLYLWGPVKKPAESQAPAQGMTPEETEIFRRLNEKYQRVYGPPKQDGKKEEEEEPSLEKVYSLNLSKLSA
jgi:hypothetical protein